MDSSEMSDEIYQNQIKFRGKKQGFLAGIKKKFADNPPELTKHSLVDMRNKKLKTRTIGALIMLGSFMVAVLAGHF